MKTLSASDIAAMNDVCRRTLCAGSSNLFVMSHGVKGDPNLHLVIEAMKSFNKFTTELDPKGEHGQGIVTIKGRRYLFLFEYIDLELYKPSEPYKPNVRRVLKLMLASEH